MKLLIATLLIFVMLAGALWAENAIPEGEFSTTREPKEAQRPAMLVAGYEILDSMDSAEIMKLWMNLMENYSKIESATGDVLYGITYFTEAYDPESHKGYAYMAATEIKSEEGLPEGMVVRKVDAASYLVFEHKGPLKYLEHSFNYIFQEFMPTNKRTMLFSDVLEVYGERYDAMNPESPDSIIEIWMPVKELD